MARYSFSATGTATTTTDILSIITAAASPRRFNIYDLMFGSSASPADNAFLWTVNRRTGAATAGSAVTGQTLDASDTIASTLVGNSLPTSNGAGAGIILSVPLNQRATFRWVAAPGSEIVASNATSNGWGIATPTSSAVSITTTALVTEI